MHEEYAYQTVKKKIYISDGSIKLSMALIRYFTHWNLSRKPSFLSILENVTSTIVTVDNILQLFALSSFFFPLHSEKRFFYQLIIFPVIVYLLKVIYYIGWNFISVLKYRILADSPAIAPSLR